MADSISRREFLEQSSLIGAAASLAPKELRGENAIPHRVLGKTGVMVPIVALGCGSRLLAYPNEEEGVAAINLALDLGITYLDSAYGYGNGKSETWVGQVMKQRRKGVFLATKINAREGEQAKRILEGSLKRLQTDQVDLIHVHSLAGEEDLAKIEAKDGVLQVLYRLRDQKVTRFIGITSHTDPSALKTAIERHDFDCVQMALNAALQGMISDSGKMILNRTMQISFEEVALPAALKKNLGILAMKVMGQEDLVGSGPSKADPFQLLQYSLSLPVATAVVGMPRLDFIRQNATWARDFKAMPESNMKDFSRRLADANKTALDLRFQSHMDC